MPADDSQDRADIDEKDDDAFAVAGWDEIGAGGFETRIIRIPVGKLLSGDSKYNVIIRPGDSIHVPLNIVGEFTIGGNVNRSGALPLTGRDITLKMAIAMAGGLNELAWPKRVEVVRRLKNNREVMIMVDLEKIAMGLQPDFYIKPNDYINVGSHGSARYLAVLRNAFRATYGFGFLYDRNFSEDIFGRNREFLGF